MLEHQPTVPRDSLRLAPGARVVIRDAEWIVRRVDRTSDNDPLLGCEGISAMVRGRQGMFLASLEEDIQILDPASTELVADDSERFRASLLYLESLQRQLTPTDERIHVAHRAAMDVVPYQLAPALQALGQPRQRILIADAVGLGKTLEAGILVAELIRRGRGRRILVLTLKSMLTQFQKGFWNRFTIPLTRLDSLGLQRVRNRIPANHNPFHYYDRAIISIDTLKQDSEYRVYLEQAWWDIIVIDEAHNVAERGSASQRARLARLLASRSDTLIVLSATPHDGRARSFASLMNMLDPTAISDPDDYGAADFRNKGLVIRRFKKDIQAQVTGRFQERAVYRHHHPASDAEEAAFRALLAVPFSRGGVHEADRPAALLRITLQKALFSSPAACRQSVANRIRELERQQARTASDDIPREIAALEILAARLEAIGPGEHARYRALLGLLESREYGWGRTADDRLVIFSERLETLEMLRQGLCRDLKLAEAAVVVLHGGLADVEQQAVVKDFARPETPVRVLLCSDVAAEGINLHYQCHRLIHFDMPWSLLVFQQRNGRIDRYGQSRVPRIDYLITESAEPTIQGDVRILEVLAAKDEQAYRNIGDPSVFMHVHEVAAEEAITAGAMAGGAGAAAFDAALTPGEDEGEALLAMFLQASESAAEPGTGSEPPPTVEAPGLFADDFAYATEALRQLNARGEGLQVQVESILRA